VLGVLSQTASSTVVGVSPEDLGDEVKAAWDRLYAAQSAPSNPFLSLPWVLSWYDTFVSPGDRVVLVVRRPAGGETAGDGESGEVIGIVPMHRRASNVGPLTIARRLLPVGAGLGENPYEIPGSLCAPGAAREVGAAVAAACIGVDVHWAEQVLAPDQTWFDWDWLAGSEDDVVFGELARARACVVLPLSSTWDETRSSLKRNIKESVRRSANRLKKDGRPWEVVRRGSDLDRPAIERFLELHRQRSQLSRSTTRPHPDAYEERTHRRLILNALPVLAEQGDASMFELYLDGEHVASQLALHAPGTSYVHSSGFREDTWQLGVVTHLHAELVRYAIERGDRVVNFSPGPNVSKLRWSEQLWVTHEFAFGAGPRSLTLRVATFDALSSIRTLRRAAARRRRQLEASRRLTSDADRRVG
jgi:hypothetical protein